MTAWSASAGSRHRGRPAWQRAERTILAKAPVVPMYNLQDATLAAKRVGNVQQHPQWGVLLDRLWVR